MDSVYDGLAVTLTKRLTHGIQMMGSYTWSHEIDDGQEQASNAIFFSSVTSAFNGNNSAERASGWLDQRHRFVYSFVWAPTITHSGSAFAKYVVNNWQLSSITTLAAGRPYGSPTIRVSSSAISGLSSSYIDGFSGNSRAPWLPVNSIFTPASYHTDARLTKLIPLKVKDRDVNLSLNFEAFNISNSWSPTSMATQEYAETTKGTLTATPTAWGYGTADGGFPDGTQARRLQVSLRVVF